MNAQNNDPKNHLQLLNTIFPLVGGWSIYSNSINQIGYLPYVPLLLCGFFLLGAASQLYGKQINTWNKYATLICAGFLLASWFFPYNLFVILGYAFSWGLLFSYSHLGLLISLPLSYFAYQYPELGEILAVPLMAIFFLSTGNKTIKPDTDWQLAIPQLLAGFVFGSLFILLWNLSWAILSPQPISFLFLFFITTPLILLKNSKLNQTISIQLSPAIFCFLLSVLWISLGFLGSELILGSFTPAQISIFFILAYSFCLLSLPAQNSSFLLTGLALGLLSFWFYSSSLEPSFWILLIGFLGILFSQWKDRLIYGLALGMIIFGFLTERKPNLDSPLINLFYPKPEAPKTAGFFNRSGWWFSTMTTSSSVVIPQTGTKDDTLIVENVHFSERIKEHKNERFFASLLQHLPNDSEQVTVLNDITGQFLSQFHQKQLPLININHPNPELLKQQAQADPARKELWLQPNIAIHPIHSEELLGKIAPQNLIIELIHLPWASPISPSINEQHIDRLSSSILPNGSVAIIIHLASIPEYSFLPITELIESKFSHVQYWLPKNNADSILVLARHTPLSFQDLKQSIQAEKKDPYSLLSHAFATSLPPPTQVRIPTPQIYPKIPILHVGSLSTSVQKPEEIWTNINEMDLRNLEPLLQQKAHFLSMIQKAAQGNMSEVLQKAQTSLEKSALQSLISPHITAAKKEIALAMKEGQSSEHWSKAQQFASTAQIIAPEAIEPWLLQGEIAIGEGFLELGEEKFQKALELDEHSLGAFNGLARIAGLQKDTQKTENYLQLALTHHPNNWTTLHNLAVFYQENGNLSAAEKYAQKAIPLSNQHAKPQIALINIHIAQEKWTLALTEVDRLLALQDSAFAWYLRGRIHFELKIWDKAEEDFRRATLSDPNLHAARGSIGLVRIAQGDKEGALQAFQATLKFDPNNEIARKNIQQLQLELDR